MNITKKPLYVEVYEKIYEKILSGEFKPGERLPGELELSKALNVSRSTLRQALLILKENGLIYNRQGIGNFVQTLNERPKNSLEQLIPIPASFSKEVLTDHILNIVFDIPNTYNSQKLQLDGSTLVMNCHKTYSINDERVCYSLYMIPTNVLTSHHVNLHQIEEISAFIEHQLCSIASKSMLHMVYTEVGEFLNEVLGQKIGEKVIMIEEIFYNNMGNPIAIVRHSILPEYFDFYVTRSGI